MAENDPKAFNERSAQRIVRATHYVERQIKNRRPRRPQVPVDDNGDLQIVQVTSTTQTDGRYPGKLIYFDADAKTKQQKRDIWIVGINDETLKTQYYLARRHNSKSSDGLHIFSTVCCLGDDATFNNVTVLVQFLSQQTAIFNGTIKLPGSPPGAPANFMVWFGTTACHMSYMCSGSTYTIERVEDKNQPNGYPGLNGSSLISTSQMGTGAPGAGNFLRGDGIWSVPPGSGMAVQEADGAPIVSPCSTLQVDQADGFVVTDLGGGTGKINLTGMTVQDSALFDVVTDRRTIQFEDASMDVTDLGSRTAGITLRKKYLSKFAWDAAMLLGGM